MHPLFSRSASWLVLSLVLALSLSSPLLQGRPQDSRLPSSPEKPGLMREGTVLKEVAVTCRYNGRQLLITLNDGQRTVIALENLMAQRLTDALQLDPTDNRWIVDGEVTEYRDENYLLVHRADR